MIGVPDRQESIAHMHVKMRWIQHVGQSDGTCSYRRDTAMVVETKDGTKRHKDRFVPFSLLAGQPAFF